MRSHPTRLVLSTLLILSGLTSSRAAEPAPSPAQMNATGWPALTKENKPWTRWWWPGSGVDKASLTRQLEQLAAAGIGGVEITPIYGAKGYEDRYIEFLSPKWVEMLEHVGNEAKRLGLGVDMATGTGWPFGGPWVVPADANTKAVLKDGVIVGEPTKQPVKRPAPGGEGLVLDPYSPEALGRYLAKFDEAFKTLPKGLVRGQFHDSFEYYGATWTAKLPEVFKEMHGYDLQQYAAALLGKANDPAVTAVDRDTLGRVKSDYRETLAKLHLDYLRAWVKWSHEHGYLVRNQSHGAPGNLLDLYANADIAETEIFGSTPFPIPGLRRDAADIANNNQDLPESLVVRMASSAAHVTGHPYASSESATWLRDHWKESLAYVKPELDRILADGINHIFYHGTVFSPQDAPWPGWLFYAATQFNPSNPWWDDFGALNQYVGRVQSVLQAGKPDNDILLYWPFADVIDDDAGTMKQFTVHNVKWLTEQPVGKLARALMERGYTFDYISDAQLLQTKAEGGGLMTPGNRYKVLVVPATRRLPVATLQQIAKLASNGAKVIFEKLPEDVPGFGRLEERRGQFKTEMAKVQGKVNVSGDVMAALAGERVPREPIAEAGISFIRRAHADGFSYFLANLTGTNFQGWTSLGAVADKTPRAVVILNPLNGVRGTAQVREGAKGQTEMLLQLAPGESLIVRTTRDAIPSNTPRWNYVEPGEPVTIAGTWQISFRKGGPELPPAIETKELKSWTDLGGDEAKRFAGTALYRIEFDWPANKTGSHWLDLGEVRESARVKLNGKDLGTAWSIPFRLQVGPALKAGRNVLELEVTNLAANRIRDMDQRKIPWKIMRDTNVVNINYRPFDASGWPLTPSGLIGPVTLVPLKALKP
jgi:hypothetical protein